jgi:hypothetical protein
MQTRIILTGLVTAGVLALAACGGSVPESQSPAAEPPATTSPPAEPPPASTEPEPGFEHPTEPDAVVVDLTTGGGFVPVEVAIDNRPEFRLHGDGTVLARPEEETFPSPPRLVRYRLTPEGIQAVLAAASEAGLLEEGPDYGQPGVTDVGTTVLTIDVDGSSYSHSAYALGFEDVVGLTAEQIDARRQLAGFADYLRNLPANAPDALAEQPAPYEPEAADVYVFEREVEPGSDAPKWPYERPPTDWPPASSDSAFGGACLTISGAELTPYLEPAEGEEWTALYKSGKKEDGTPRFWSIGIDLVLPGETGCTA